MPELRLTLTRISPTHHRLDFRRPDGTGESIELETKTFLYHDLLHFAAESEAGLQHSFYGLLAQGKLYTDMTERGSTDEPLPGEIGVTERIVGGLTGYLKADNDPDAFISMMKNLFDAYHEALPPYLTPAYLERVKERMRRLMGEWNATAFGDSMALTFVLNDKPSTA